MLSRLVITTTTGAVQLWQQDVLQWTREESLAAISVAEFVELPERVISSTRTGDENFARRLVRQLSDAQVICLTHILDGTLTICRTSLVI